MRETDTSGGCGCGGGCSGNCCGSTPPEFVRLRYFFGQRLGVVDFQDEQSYVVGKQRLHNRLLHGAGVLCGLNVARFVFPQTSPPNTPTTVLRVTRGVAIDACGREILVGADQCIDVNSWFQAHLTNPELSGLTPPGPLDLVVALRYRECPSDPSPAPRDACGCGSNGCEYGRIRESFQLSLLTVAEFSRCATVLHPTLQELQQAMTSATNGSASQIPIPVTAVQALGTLAALACSDSSGDACLALARIQVSLALGPVVDNITNVSIDIPDRLTLVPSCLQQVLAGTDPAELGGPQISGVSFDATSSTITVHLTLGQSGNPPTDVPIAEATLAGAFQLFSFDPVAGTWTAVTITQTYTAPDVALECTGLTAGLYRLALTLPEATPVVDLRMRSLSPRHFATRFRLADQGGVLAVASSLF